DCRASASFRSAPFAEGIHNAAISLASSSLRSATRSRLRIVRSPPASAVSASAGLSRLRMESFSDVSCATKDAGSIDATPGRLLLLFHRSAAALEAAGATLGDDHLRAALRANVDFSKLIGHFRS